ncbi:MAG: nitrite reductase large subunit NirB [Saprospiraceae bacterium]|nr:nitrite reductase large subunit NirB [Lewinella sp.]
MKKIVVIGNGMVGYKFCEKLIQKAAPLNIDITVFGEEVRPAYDRVHLSEYFSGKTAEDLSLAPADWYRDNNIQLLTGELVTRIDPQQKTITSHRGQEYVYDQLVLATGSSPFVPPIDGVNKSGVFVYRTIEDLESISSYGRKIAESGNRKAAVLGGGLLGLEAAKALKDMDLETHVIEFAPRLMPRQLDEAGGLMLQEIIENMGIGIHTATQTSQIGGNGSMTHLEFAGNKNLDAQMLVISAGIRPRDELARNCGLTVGPRGGVVIDARCRTSDHDIFAIGEVALYQDQIYGLVAPGYDMAEVAAAQIVGEDKTMVDQIDMSTKLKLMGVEVASFGDHFAGAPARTIVFEDKFAGIYKRINISEDGKKLLGGILVGDTSDYNMLLQIAQNGMALPANPEDLILGARGGDSSALGSVLDLPDSAQICSCEAITKGDICSAIEEGYQDLKSLSKCTKATTGCGGCKPIVADLLAASLKAMGKTVKATICEHFPYSRQELYDLIVVKGIRNYDEALDEIGHGDGCELCKPALASVFAGITNETATVQESIQDTNDRFLANIQRNGSYSVVPRIPGGEITPEKLIVIGQVAKKYDLYAKITGGQRIDLFGATVNQLPAIWEELIAAGFESGHAYGKALRTIKSCVGSTWCRYGMDESVSFAIELEERYKGIRSPHKLKGAVSGCIRECAEARCKDFGLIATEKGWNLYVCGNGGAKPRHAELLAENIDNEHVVRYIDRFLMFYIKTAGPLMRTATWLEKLEGGIEYLRKVVVEDSLGIAESLEDQMQTLISNYRCEWREVVENPDLKQRFSHFVNSPEPDDHMGFVAMREQKMPKPW